MAETVPTTTEQAIINQATTGTEPEFTISFADGKVYKDKDPAKIIAEAEKRYNALYPHKTTLENENKALRELAANNQKQTDGFDQNRYIELWATNAMDAEKYRRSYDPEWQKGVQEINSQKWNNSVAQFRAKHPEFKPTDENTAILAKTIDQLYPKDQMGDVVLNADQIEAAHLKAVNEKFYTVEAVGGKVEDKKIPPVPPAGGGSQQEVSAADINKMTQSELRAHIEKEFAKQQSAQ